MLGYCSHTLLFRWYSLNISVVANFKVFSQEIWAFLEIVSIDCFFVHVQAILTCSSVCLLRNMLNHIPWQLGKPDSHGPSSGLPAAAVSDFSRLHSLLCAASEVLITNEWTDFPKRLKPPAFVRCCVGPGFQCPVGSFISDVACTSCLHRPARPASSERSGPSPTFLGCTSLPVEITLDPTQCQSFADCYGHPSVLPCVFCSGSC